MSLDRRWLELSARSPTAGDRAPLLVEGLLALGGRATEERDGWYVTHVPVPADVDRFTVTARDLLAAITRLNDVELRAGFKEHEDWAETWRRGFGARRISGRLVVRPTWVEASSETESDLVILLDPGMAFGTGEHGTTRGCLRTLDRVVTAGDTVLDVGAGSGILSIAAVHLGASSVLAVESDSLACEALGENLTLNGVTDRVRVVELSADAEWLAARGPCSGIVANIEAGLLIPLLPGFSAALLAEGWLILSGVMAGEWTSMCARTQAEGFRLVEVDADGAWRTGLFRRSG